MDEIVSSVETVTDIIGEITRRLARAGRGIEQVNRAVMQMDQVTQQNAAVVSRAAMAADSVQDHARRLVESVSAFKLEGTGGTAEPPAPRAPARTARLLRPGQVALPDMK